MARPNPVPHLANRGQQRGLAVLALVLLMTGVCSGLHALAKPFWYDEICTVILCKLPGMSEVWSALSNAADTNPPLFYVVARLARKFVGSDHLGYRLPSILALMSTVGCVYVILGRRVKPLPAVLGASFLLSTPAAAFAFEARPYALVLACISGAILAWQRIEDGKVYAILLTLTLAAAVSLHYYAILVWPAFVLAELSVWVFRRRFRLLAWASLAAGTVPLFFFAGLLAKLRQYYGQHFWAHPGMEQIYLAQNWLFGFGSDWGWMLAVGFTTVLLALNVSKKELSSAAGERQVSRNVVPVEEQVLILCLLWLPLIAVVAAKLSHGGMTWRYMLPAALGGALVFGFLFSEVPRRLAILVLVLLLVNYSATSLELVKSVIRGTLFRARTAAVLQVKGFIQQQPGLDFPIVISSGLEYLPAAYYTRADLKRKLFMLTDPPAALRFTEDQTDSVDLAMLVLQRYAPLQVEDYAGFIAQHREFLLLSNADGFDWWPARLTQDGNTLTLLTTGKPAVYKVTIKR